MKPYLLIFLLFLVFNSVFGQKDNYLSSGYYSEIYKADSLFIVGQYQKSFEILDSLFKEKKPVELPIYYEYRTYAKVAYLTNNKSSAIDAVKELTLSYGLTWNNIQNDTLLTQIVKENAFNLENYDELRNKYEIKTHPELREKIRKMKLSDQRYRGSNNYMENREKQDTLDYINTGMLIEILDAIGYPNFHKLGNSSTTKITELDITTILLHTKFTLRKYFFLPKLIEYIEAGECDPEVYGYTYDQMLLYSGKPQKYGTYSGKNAEIQSFDSLNIYRKSIGLPNYGYKEWRFKRLYGPK